MKKANGANRSLIGIPITLISISGTDGLAQR
jgi:hypothetical protein